MAAAGSSICTSSKFLTFSLCRILYWKSCLSLSGRGKARRMECVISCCFTTFYVIQLIIPEKLNNRKPIKQSWTFNVRFYNWLQAHVSFYYKGWASHLLTDTDSKQPTDRISEGVVVWCRVSRLVASLHIGPGIGSPDLLLQSFGFLICLTWLRERWEQRRTTKHSVIPPSLSPVYISPGALPRANRTISLNNVQTILCEEKF